MIEFVGPNYQAAYSQLARKFTMLAYILTPSGLVGAEADSIILDAMKLIQAIEKAELTVQVINEEES